MVHEIINIHKFHQPYNYAIARIQSHLICLDPHFVEAIKYSIWQARNWTQGEAWKPRSCALRACDSDHDKYLIFKSNIYRYNSQCQGPRVCVLKYVIRERLKRLLIVTPPAFELQHTNLPPSRCTLHVATASIQGILYSNRVESWNCAGVSKAHNGPCDPNVL